MDPKNKLRKPFPDSFYYSEKAEEHPSSTTARLDMETLATGGDSQSLWANTFSSFEEKKKTVVITEWRLARLPDVALEAHRLLINSLLLNGFSVYLLQEEGIEPLHSAKLQRQQLEKIRDLPRAKVYKIATATLPHSSADEILLFDFDAQKELAEHFGFPVVRPLPPKDSITPMDVMNPSVVLSKEFIATLPTSFQEPLEDLHKREQGNLRESGILPLTRVRVQHPKYYDYYGAREIKIYSYGTRTEDESSGSHKIITELLSTVEEGNQYNITAISLETDPHDSILPQSGKIYDYSIRWRIESFAWMEHISDPTHLTFRRCSIPPNSLASCAHISNTYITRLTIDNINFNCIPAGFFKAILKATPQLQFLTILGNVVENEGRLQECLDSLPTGCQLDLKMDREVLRNEAGCFFIKIRCDIEDLKIENVFNFNLKPENYQQESAELKNGIQRIHVTYSDNDFGSKVSLRNAVSAYHIKLTRLYVEDNPKPEELHFPQLEVLELDGVRITRRLLRHIILYAPQLKKLVFKECMLSGGNFGVDIVEALLKLPHFEELDCSSVYFTPEARDLLNDQKKFDCDRRVIIEVCPPTILSSNDVQPVQEANICTSQQSVNENPPATTGKPKRGVVYTCPGSIPQQCDVDGKLALQEELPVHNRQPYFISFPEDRAEKPLRQGVFYLDEKDDYRFKNVKNKQKYQLVSNVKVGADPLNYQRGSYMGKPCTYEQSNPQKKLICEYEHYNPGLTLNCVAGVRTVLYNTSSQDVLVALSVRPSSGKTVSVTVERGTIDGLYYLITKENIKIICEFVMVTPPENLRPVPKPLQELANEIKTFNAGTKNLSGEFKTNEQRLKALWKLKEGACRHRTEVFLYKASKLKKSKELPDAIQTYRVEGTGHAWPEWCHADMPPQNFDCLGGGHPPKIIYHEDDEFNNVKLEVKAEAPDVEEKEQSVKTDSFISNPLKFFANLLSPEPTETAQLIRRRLQFTPKSEPSIVSKDEEENMSKEVMTTAGPSQEPPIQVAPKKKEKAQMKTITVAQCLELEQGKNYLVIAKDSNDTNTLIDRLLTEAPHRIHTVHHGKRLHTVGKGLIQEGQGWVQSEEANGALNHFLKKCLEEGVTPIIILEMSAGDLVKYNALFGRHINGIPENAVIITRATPDSAILEDNSILSRQHKTLRLLVEESALEPPIEDLARHTVSLYGTDDWQAWLLGYCIYNSAGKRVIFKGYLLEAIEKGFPIKIIHPPKNNADFDVFIRDLNAKKMFWFLDQWHKFPQGVVVDRKGHYDFSSLHPRMSVVTIPPQQREKHHYLINSHTFERCLHNTVVVGELPCQDFGWIEMAAGGTLQLYVTDNLSVGQWYCLLETCVKHDVRLQVELAPGVSLPHELRDHYPAAAPNEISNAKNCRELGQILFGSPAGGTMIYSENHLESYYQCQKLLKEDGYKLFSADSNPQKPYLLIDASELSDESALYCNPIFNDKGKIKARCDISDILEVLKRQDGIVVLTGDLQPALLSHLSSLFLDEPYLWVNGAKREIKGHLIVIPEKGQPLSQWIGHNRKWLHPIPPKPAVVPQAIPVLPTKVSDELWWSEEEFKDVLEARKEFVLTALEDKPFVFLQGPAGSGKSSLALQLQNEPDANISVYYEEAIAAWAADTTPGKAKILFIDEANLRTQQQWTLFQGLFNDPPGIYYNQKFYPLTKDHKVIFAGNPLDHGGKRIEPTLFKRYPECTIHCPLLPAAYIEHAVLRGIFKYIPELSANTELLAKACRAFLDGYDATMDDIRSLQSKAMLHCYEKIPKLNSAEKEKEPVASKYVLLDSRRPCQKAIIDSLKIQQFKHWAQAKAGDNGSLLDAACYGGHSGVLITGAPDAGKTELIEATLFEQGYSKMTLGSAPKENNGKVYYVMDPRNMDEILERAFQEGVVLVWDEINSYLTPALTAKLNSYLSGYSLNKKAPKHAGFTLLSSINPAYMQGRAATDTALNSRLKQERLKKYQDYEVDKIFNKVTEDLSEDQKQKIASIFFEERQAAVDNGSAKPGPRYLQQLVTEVRKEGAVNDPVISSNPFRLNASKSNSPQPSSVTMPLLSPGS